jgi:Domain of unknown function (DUF4331)/Polyketide cyclase / dehydrase and lipid transport
MADHIDGPRTIGDRAIDLTDLFAFQSPADPSRLVLIVNVLPFAGETGYLSNAANYALGLKRVKMLGVGKEAGFEPFGPEARFTFQFEPLAAAQSSQVPPAAQTGICILPSGERIPLIVGDEKGAYSQNKSVRVFAGVRSDPFFIAWTLSTLEPVPNYAQEDNVIGLVVEINIEDYFPTRDGSLFGLIGESAPRFRGPTTLEGPRYDWIGRPEQLNFIFYGLPNSVDLRDLWNQQEPFAPMAPELVSIYRQRLYESFRFWDGRDGSIQWTGDALDAHVNVRMNDFLLFDVSKPITDNSHLEIEKSAIAGQQYKTGGGRTIDANVIDILITYLVNRDQGKFYQSPATQATQKGLKVFPYLAPPNKVLQRITRDIPLKAGPHDVWAAIGDFAKNWNPAFAALKTIGTGLGQVREIETIYGKRIFERLDLVDQANLTLKYTVLSGLPAHPNRHTLSVKPQGQGCVVSWLVEYRAESQGELIAHMDIEQLMAAGIQALQRNFGAP